MVWPLIQRPGPARKDTTSAMSPGTPRRPSGFRLAMCSMVASSLPSRNSGVAVGPGATAFTVMSRPCNSFGEDQADGIDRPLCGGIRGVGGQRQLHDRGGEVDDGATTADSSCGLLVDHEGAADVDPVHPVEVGEVEVGQRG